MDAQTPLVSIIIPSYNRAHVIGETLDSVQNQSYQNWECIVVDDLSKDNTDEIMQQRVDTDMRIHYYKRHREPKGAPTCRNIGLDKASGDYVIFLDSDDLLADFCLKRRIQLFAENNQMDFLVFQSVIFNNSIDDTKKYFNVENEESDLNRFLRTESLWAICGCIYKLIVIKDFSFNESLPFWQDVDLGVRLLINKKKYCKFFGIIPDAYIRQSKYSVSRNGGFGKTPELLSKRIEILLSFNMLAKKMEYSLSNNEIKTLYNFCYILAAKILIEFYNHKIYFTQWYNSGKNLGMLNINWGVGYLYLYLIYWRKYSVYFIKIRSLFKSLFGKYIPDMNELDKLKLHRISYETEVSINDENFNSSRIMNNKDSIK